MVRSLALQAAFLCIAVCLLLPAADAQSGFNLNCNEDQSNLCFGIANCNAANDALDISGFRCSCPDGMFGSGYVDSFVQAGHQLDGEPIADAGCDSEAAVIRVSVLINNEWNDITTGSVGNLGRRLTEAGFVGAREWIINEVFSGQSYPYSTLNGFVYRIDTVDDCGGNEGTVWFTANLLFKDQTAASAYLNANLNPEIAARERTPIQNASGPFISVNSYEGVSLQYSADIGNGANTVGALAAAPRVYSWTTGTVDDPITIMPVGMNVLSVDFKHDCLTAGCWVVDVEYTRGEDGANVFYIPRSHNDDTLSYDYDYLNDSDNHMTYTTGDVGNSDVTWTLEKTYQPANFPCGNDAYDPTVDSSTAIQRTVSACCIPEFIENYRPLEGLSVDSTFGDSAWNYIQLKTQCEANYDNAPTMTLSNLFCSSLSGQFHDPVNFAGQYSDITTPYAYSAENMKTSHVDYMGVIDPYLGIYRARFFLDEVELRRFGGQLTGTVSVEHSMDFFVGLANFKPTSNQFFDMAASQIDIHVEKTDFFTVSTHGENAYTFLRYINLRLIQVYDQDIDNTDDAATANFYRTEPTYTTQYVQVTFTLGQDYEVKPGFDIIPIDSVRIGSGTFSTNAQFAHACLDWESQEEGELGMSAADRTAFEVAVNQSCGPQSTMCYSPPQIPDSFVVYNVPAFNKVEPTGYFGEPSPSLANNIFIDMVIQVQNRAVMMGGGTTGNITKTTLRASIPVVEGGINLFCDAVGAKSDLAEVADVTIVYGSANTESEFNNLRVEDKLAATALSPQSSRYTSASSIEAALMTVILLGNESFFRDPFASDGSAASDFGLELEDVVTIHIMEDNDPDGNGPVDGFDTRLAAGKVLALIDQAGEELFDSNNELQTGGYALNGAFDLVIDRQNNLGKLQPTSALLQAAPVGPGCAFSASMPATGTAGVIPTTCVIRRDISGRNCLGKRPGAVVTASELPYCQTAACTSVQPPEDAVCETHLTPSEFFETMLGENDFARTLGTNYATLIAQKFKLNNRSRRAWFVNPGYEWTAQQTGGVSRFQITSKLFMFALVGLNEQRGQEMESRRRFLLQAGAGDGSTTAASAVVDTGASTVTVLAQASGVTEDDVAWIRMEVALTEEEACMSDADLKEALRTVVANVVDDDGVAQNVLTAQVHDVRRELNGVQCRRRHLARSLQSYSTATAKLNAFVVFEKEEDAEDRFINLDAMSNVLADRALSMSAGNVVAEDVDCPTCPKETVTTTAAGDATTTAGDATTATGDATTATGDATTTTAAGDATTAAGVATTTAAQATTTLATSPAPNAVDTAAAGGGGELTHEVVLRVNLPYSLAEFEANKGKLVTAFAEAAGVPESQVSMTATERDARRRLLASVDVDVVIQTASESAATAVQQTLSKKNIDAKLAEQGLQPATIILAASVGTIDVGGGEGAGAAALPSLLAVSFGLLTAVWIGDSVCG